MTALVSVALKGLVVLLAAALGARVLRRASASTRHGVWAVAFAALVLLPLMEMAGPRWSVGVLPAPTASAATVPPAPPAAPSWAHSDPPAANGDAFERVFEQEFEGEMAAFERNMEAFDSDMEAFDARAEGFGLGALAVTDGAPGGWSPPALIRAASRAGGWLVGLWGLGVLGIGLGWLAAFLAAHRIVVRASPETDAEWNVTAERARRLTGLSAPVRLLRSDALDVPVAWGWGGGAVVLPADADGWDEDRREAVLLHELAHLARRDAWSQAVAQAALAVHWINPLAWWGYRRFLDAREHACDDAVLRAGARPSAYAAHLVGVARSAGRDRLALAAVAPMARTAPIESRVVSVLDPARQRRPLGRGAVAGTVALAAAVCVPLAALQPVAQTPPAPVPIPDWTAVADTLDRLYQPPADSLAGPWGEVERAVETARAETGQLETGQLETGQVETSRVATAVSAETDGRSEAHDRDPVVHESDRSPADEITREVGEALTDADQEIEEAIADIEEQIGEVRREGGPEAGIRMQALRAAQSGLAQIDRQALRDRARAAVLDMTEPAARARESRREARTSPPSPASTSSPRARPAPPAPASSVDWSDVDRARQAAQRRRSQ